jgi:hypothetical protein
MAFAILRVMLGVVVVVVVVIKYSRSLGSVKGFDGEILRYDEHSEASLCDISISIGGRDR